MLANSIAWGVGIPIVFAAVDLAQKSQTTAGAVAIFALALLITGAVVGAIHGAVLVQLAKRRKSQTD